ncbi:hypothetical protein DV515_00016610 [Chloebia gouldiae]|uniref:Uncharacterized protein n=1 Tax=Chloebia gouldiae TaxID=44316 RepID=A0A3L8RRV0_CHLGU|nr:hypothetical protein DV515_00016610 [Chloebia gouldiae]
MKQMKSQEWNQFNGINSIIINGITWIQGESKTVRMSPVAILASKLWCQDLPMDLSPQVHLWLGFTPNCGSLNALGTRSWASPDVQSKSYN